MAERPNVRIKDIAEKSNVSPATVSLVLNNKGGVGQDTRNRIIEIAQELGYNGPALRKRDSDSSNTICFVHITRHGHILNRDHDVFISDYIEGLSHETQNQRYLLNTVTFKSAAISEIILFINNSDAAGFIILGTELSSEDIQTFTSINKPLVFLDAYYPHLNHSFIDMNNTDIIYDAVSFLENMGHKKIGLINGTPLTPNFLLRETAYRSVMDEKKLPITEHWILHIDSLFEEGYRSMLNIIPRMKDLPTAFVCGNDILAAASLKALKEKGIRVPHDISLIGIDNLPLTERTTPTLSSFEVNKVELGSIAVQLLLRQVNNRKSNSNLKLLLSGTIIERESVRDINVP